MPRIHHIGDQHVNDEIHHIGAGHQNVVRGQGAPVQDRPKNRVRERREAAGLTQEQLAAAMSTSVQQVSRLERSERNLTDSWLNRLATALGCAKRDLIFDPAGTAGAEPGSGDIVKNDIERTLLAFWRSLSPEDQNVILEWIDLWAERRHRQTGTH